MPDSSGELIAEPHSSLIHRLVNGQSPDRPDCPTQLATGSIDLVTLPLPDLDIQTLVLKNLLKTSDSGYGGGLVGQPINRIVRNQVDHCRTTAK